MARKAIQKRQDFLNDEAFEAFIAEKKAHKLSEATITGYDKTWKHFTEFKGNKAINKPLINEYINYMISLNYADATVNHYLRNLRVILYFMMDNDYLEPFKMHLIKAKQKIKETYTEADLKILLKKPSEDDFNSYRTWVIINYLLSTGNRLSTIVNIRIKDIDFEEKTVTLQHTKNGIQQIIPLSDIVLKILKKFISLWRYNASPDDYLFCNQYDAQLSKNALETAIHRYNKSRGVCR